MAKRQLSVAASLIDEAAVNAGAYTLDGRRISSFGVGLLVTHAENLDEHFDVQAAAGLFYNRILAAAEEKKRLLERRFELWYARAYARCVKDWSGQYKPTKDDIKHSVCIRYKQRYGKYMRLLDKARRELQAISDWCLAWKQKAFSIEGLSKERFGMLTKQASDLKREVKKRAERVAGRVRKRPK